MNQLISSVLRKLKHKIESKGADGIHSPFLFDLYTKVLKNPVPEQYRKIIEVYRNSLFADKQEFIKNDFGAGTTFKGKKTIAKEAGLSATKPKNGKLLYNLIQHFKPKNILELGTNTGFSILYMALAASTYRKSVEVFTIEGDEFLCKSTQNQYNKLQNIYNDLPEINFINGLFNEKLPEVLVQLQELDFVFIDGDHRGESLIRYFEMLLPKINPKSIIVLDDISWSADMQNAWLQITQNKQVTLSVDFGNIGVLFFDKKLSKELIKVSW